MWGDEEAGWREAGVGDDAHFPLFANTKSISCLAKLSLTVFLLGRARVFSQPSETGQTQSSGEDAEDGKSASPSACPSAYVAA